MGTRTLQLLRQNWTTMLVLTLLVGGYFLLRTQPSDVASLEELEAILRDGQPTVIEFYANT
jgi:hypothetical protein